MKIHIKNCKGLVLPQKAHENDSGHDIVAMSDARIVGSFIERMDGVKMWSKIDFIEYDTNIQLQPQDKDVYTLVFDEPLQRCDLRRNGVLLFSDINPEVCKAWAADNGKLKQHPGWSVSFPTKVKEEAAVK